ncbi:hypothetical protein OJ996_11195 [Luteolibacter sp. GHJ8]|uniref:Lipocalin-like domain-containing protein n=1 Tax=Luteolibacter rhizosphaerae TaxID=2989719 RepID=A0ABT3G2T8_9BACT|nr:hypothetical protein [Luteolibacter rhizosphaerae]MCW1914145.1 hypothetical protein [Luteolibacter rhizosphaerae]
MKRLLITAFMILFAACASAIELKDLAGNWSGLHIETVKGRKTTFISTYSGTMPETADSLYLVETTTSPYPVTGTYTLYKGGAFSSTAMVSGVILSAYYGTWKIKKGKIILSGVGTNGKFKALVSVDGSSFQVKGKAGRLKLLMQANRVP